MTRGREPRPEDEPEVARADTGRNASAEDACPGSAGSLEADVEEGYHRLDAVADGYRLGAGREQRHGPPVHVHHQ